MVAGAAQRCCGGPAVSAGGATAAVLRQRPTVASSWGRHPRKPIITRQRVRASAGDGAAGDAADEEEEEVPQVMGDWRSFRAKLVSETSEYQGTTKEATDNFQLLQQQNPSLAAEGLWCHPAEIEQGGLIVALRAAPDVIGDERYWQVVMLLIQHDSRGSVGLILNRPAGVTLGALPVPESGASSIQVSFKDNSLYLGGFEANQVVHLLHGRKDLEGVTEVVPGVYLGGEMSAVEAVDSGRAEGHEFRFFAGCKIWEPGRLQQEIEAGAWASAACSRSLVLKQCLGLPTPLWKEALELMGGEYGITARSAYGEV